MRAVAFALALTLATTRAPLAHADAPTPAAPAPSSPAPAVWYGWQMLIADGAAVTAASLTARSTALQGTLAGAAFFLVSGPTLHGIHGQSGRALPSFAMRMLVALAGVSIGIGLATCPQPSSTVDTRSAEDACSSASLEGAFYGLVGGMGVAAVLDASLLAWKTPPAPSPLHAASAPPLLQWLPALGVAVDSGRNTVPTFGIAGSF